ncbi:MAG TPA: molybdopterin-dependent oxidoreductase [Thermodesulfobacteriota bacterium]|nr:molybdopterin-dependent oxidoreductase [Thermodesulfobacteriota bacterium]
MKRRDFIKYLGAGGIGTAMGIFFGKNTKPPGAKLIPYLVPPEEIVPGVGAWYSTLCAQCGAGCGIIVKVMAGRAKKIEGNPLHPVSRGRLCAMGQAAPQGLYNPDRIKGPLKRAGSRGSESFMEVSWEEALRTLAENLAGLKVKGSAEGLYVLAPPLRGHLDALIRDFTATFGSPNYLPYDLFDNRNLAFANAVSMGMESLPHYDIENTRYLVSFGADFSSTWLSPVNLSYGYGQMRQGSPGVRGTLVQVEPRMSLTGANADEWVPARPGTEGLVALAMAHVIVAEGRYRGREARQWRSLLEAFSPVEVAKVSEVEEKRIERLAHEFASTRPSLAIGGDVLSGYTDGVSGLVAVNILNHVAGNIGVKGGVVPNPVDPFFSAPGRDFTRSISTVRDAAESGALKTLLTYNANPLFTTPDNLRLRESLDKVPFMASLSSFMDETTAMADLVLPVHHFLEDWADDFCSPSVGKPVATIMQPAVSPKYNTMGAGDVFLELARRLRHEREKALSGGTEILGEFMDERFSVKDFQEHLKRSWRELHAKDRRLSGGNPTFEGFWNRLLKDGGWWPEGAPMEKGPAVRVKDVAAYMPKGASMFEGEEAKHPFYLMVYPQAGLLDGRGANSPWLQELPDPMTSVVWGSWVEINPATAMKLGIKEGEMVTVESPYGKIDAPAYLYPGIRPDTVAVPIGQGHRSYGRYAKETGANPMDILPSLQDKGSGALSLNSTRVNVSRSPKPGWMVKIEATKKEYGREIVQTVTPEEFERMNKEAT